MTTSDTDLLYNKDGQYAPKITDWAKEPDLKDLKADAEAARPAQQIQVSKIRRWNDILKATGKFAGPNVKGRSSVQPKLTRQQAEWRYAALSEPFLGSNKLFNVKPVTFEDDNGAKQNELVLNWQFRTKLNRVKFIDDLVRSTVDDGTSIVRVGWKRNAIKIWQEVPVYDHYPIQDEQQLQMFQQAMQMKEEDIRGFNEQADPALKAALEYYEESGQATIAVQTGTQRVQVEKLLENKPELTILNPTNVIIDPSCEGDMDKALFAIISFETCQADLKKEPDRYKNLEYVLWESASPATTADHATNTPDSFQFTDELRKKVVAYEYWGYSDIKGDGTLVPIVCTWIGNTMIRCEENPYPDQKLPFVVIPYLPVKRDLYGEPDAEMLVDFQQIHGAITRGMVDLLGRSANSQIGFAKGMLDPLNRKRFDSGADYEFNPNANPQNNLIEHKFPELPQSAMMMLNIQQNQAESMTGVKSFSGGVSGESYGQVAAGIRGALDAASKREMAILRRIAKGMMEIATKITAMNQVFMSEKEVVRVTNQEFVTVLRDDLQGNFDLEVDISTAEVDNQKSQDLAFMLQTVGPNTDPQIMMTILAEIADLKRMPALAQKLRMWKPTPDPIVEQLKQLEVQKAQMEIQKLQSEIALNDAKAKQAGAQGDLANLDFVEQETGTKHARDMALQKAQSEGNQNLQVTKALTQPVKEGEKAPNINAAVGFNAISDKLNQASQPMSPSSMIGRDLAAQQDNSRNLNSSRFQPQLDPALNPAMNL
jgi:hypothetical protein